jgi:CRP/FNR family transcriptional regulator, cyclic AMP receptor protein
MASPAKADVEAAVLKRGWLAHQAPDFQRAVLQQARLVSLRADEYLFHAGDATGGIYGVVSGGVGVLIPGLGSALRLAQVLRAGVWFGHGPIMTGRARVLSFRATEPSLALHAPIAALQEIAASQPTWAHAVGSLSDFSVDIAIAAVSDLLIPDSARRLAAVLLRAAALDMDNPPAKPVPLSLRQSEIAEMANLSERMVGRILKRFEVSGWIEAGYGGLTLADPKALREFAAED